MLVFSSKTINDTFMNKKQARLINPTKTELGLVAKNVIKTIVTKIFFLIQNITYGRTL